eukprot:GHVP01017022.1.p1 GENE.GHVP01017022.1~~GHVP01017022.1.p1  ORF type:complete len:150 (-),score=31.05 GHVP01017022.1:386-835(-)
MEDEITNLAEIFVPGANPWRFYSEDFTAAPREDSFDGQMPPGGGKQNEKRLIAIGRSQQKKTHQDFLKKVSTEVDDPISIFVEHTPSFKDVRRQAIATWNAQDTDVANAPVTDVANAPVTDVAKAPDLAVKVLRDMKTTNEQYNRIPLN